MSKRKSISKKLRYRVIDRDNCTCRRCGRKCRQGSRGNDQLTIDHIKPVSQGGTNDLDNLQVLCRECNLGKSDTVKVGNSYHSPQRQRRRRESKPEHQTAWPSENWQVKQQEEVREQQRREEILRQAVEREQFEKERKRRIALEETHAREQARIRDIEAAAAAIQREREARVKEFRDFVFRIASTWWPILAVVSGPLLLLFLIVAFPKQKPHVEVVAAGQVQDIADEAAILPPKEGYHIQQTENNLPDYYKWVIEVDENYDDEKIKDISLRLLGGDAKYTSHRQ